MRSRRYAHKSFLSTLLIAAVGITPIAVAASSGPRPKEVPTSWKSSLASPTIRSQPRSDLPTSQELALALTPFANAVNAFQANQAAQAFQAAEARIAASTASARAAQSTSTRTAPSTATTSPPTPSSEAPGGIWACIIDHESNGDPTAVNPSSGASGLYQFETGTWLANGGGQYAPTAAQATPGEQTAIAEATQARDGWSPWVGDGCTPDG